jgi:hypothetical protein
LSVTNIALPAFDVSTDIAAEPDGLENAIIVPRLDRRSVSGLTLDFALNLEKTGLDGCGTAQASSRSRAGRRCSSAKAASTDGGRF